MHLLASLSHILIPTLVSLLLPTPATCDPPPYGPYNITEYFDDCIGGEGCFHSFNIAFTPDPLFPPPYTSGTEPPFTASCSGDSSQTTFATCNDTTVSAYVAYGNVDELYVEHTWLVPEGPDTRAAQYTITGNVTVPEYTGEGTPSFQIFATQETVES